MKPKNDENEIINWNAMKVRTKKEDKIIKEIMEKAWKKNYKKR